MRKIKILWAEDDLCVAEALGEALVTENCDIVCCGSSREAPEPLVLVLPEQRQNQFPLSSVKRKQC